MGDTVKTSGVQYTSVDDQQEVFTDLTAGQYKMNCGVLLGFVNCNTDPNKGPVSGIIVKAENIVTKEHYLGMTDDNGFYAICVPVGDYRIFPLICDDACLTPTKCKKKKHYK